MKAITSLLLLISLGVFGQTETHLIRVQSSKHITPFAEYDRYTLTYKEIPLLDEQQLVLKSIEDQQVTKELSTLHDYKIAVLPSSPIGPYLWFDGIRWLDVFADTLVSGATHQLTIRTEDEILEVRDLNAHYTDTTVAVRVFNPDPLSPFGFSYGGNYVDLNDGNGSILDSLTIIDSIKVQAIPGGAVLENDYLKVVDFDAPYIAPSTQPTAWTGGREASEFEQVMVVYHISKMNVYLDSLGYDSLLNYAIHVDPHALNGQDQSMFNFGYTPPRLYFGEGGVDDAEDADVIIHELSHAISHAAAPNTNTGTERRTFDESLGDYFAERYGRKIGVTSNRVFDWDGNNTFWNGRSVAYDGVKNYNTLFFSNIYQHTDIMTSAMLEFSSASGVDPALADMVVLEACHMLMPNQTLRKIAKNFLVADSLVTGGLYQNQILNAFGAPKNILVSNEVGNIVSASSPSIFPTSTGERGVLNPTQGNLRCTEYDALGRVLSIRTVQPGTSILNSHTVILEAIDETGHRFTLKVR